jgi:hypothetical protein
MAQEDSQKKFLMTIFAVGACLVLVFFILMVVAFYLFVSQIGAEKPTVVLPFKDDGQKLVLTNNLTAQDPTYAQLLQFMKDDDTENVSWSSGQSIVRLHDNAEKKGIKAGVLEMKPLGYTENGVQMIYACNVFHTTDQGTVYVKSPGQESDVSGDDVVIFGKGRLGNDEVYYVPLDTAIGKSYAQLDESMGTLMLDYPVIVDTYYW